MYWILILICFLLGINNDPLSINIVKKWHFIEIISILILMYVIFGKKRMLTNSFFNLSIIFVAWSIFCLIIAFDYFPYEHNITESKSIFTTYGTRGTFVLFQLVFNISLALGLYSFLVLSKVSPLKIELCWVSAVTASCLLGILVYLLQQLGMEFSFIQSNMVSYSKYRLYGLSLEPQYMALYIMPVCFVSLKNKWHGSLAICTSAFILTFSTTLLLAFGVALFWLYLRTGNVKHKLKYLPLLLMLLPVIVFFSYEKAYSFFSSIASVSDSTTDYARAYSMYIAAQLIQEHWLTGVGLGNFSYYFEWRGEEKIFNVANIFLRVATETGFIGLFFFVASLYSLNKKIRSIDPYYYAIFICTMVYFLVNSTFYFMLSFWLLFSLILAIKRGREIGKN